MLLEVSTLYYKYVESCKVESFLAMAGLWCSSEEFLIIEWFNHVHTAFFLFGDIIF